MLHPDVLAIFLGVIMPPSIYLFAIAPALSTHLNVKWLVRTLTLLAMLLTAFTAWSHYGAHELFRLHCEFNPCGPGIDATLTLFTGVLYLSLTALIVGGALRYAAAKWSPSKWRLLAPVAIVVLSQIYLLARFLLSPREQLAL